MKPYALVAAVLLLAACSPSAAEVQGKPGGTCSDANDARLASVELTDMGDDLRVEWVTDGTTTSTDVLWSVAVQNAKFTSAYTVGVQQLTGQDLSVWLYNRANSSAGQVNLPIEAADVSPTGVSADFPWDELGDLSTGAFEWTATLSLDGVDVATCPNPGDAVKMPTNTFARK